MNTPNERIKLLRKEKGMLQDDVATLINSSRFNISRYENGIPIPSEVIAAYARAFDVSTDWLLCLTSDRKTGGSDLAASVDELAELTSKAGGAHRRAACFAPVRRKNAGKSRHFPGKNSCARSVFVVNYCIVRKC